MSFLRIIIIIFIVRIIKIMFFNEKGNSNKKYKSDNLNNDHGNKDNKIEFGKRISWITIKENSMKEASDFLCLQAKKEMIWNRGLESSRSRNILFVFPVAGKGVIITGTPFAITNDDTWEESVFPVIEKISQKYGKVCYFGNHNISDYYAWVKADNGKIERSYAYAGDTEKLLSNYGQKTWEEKELHLKLYENQEEINEERRTNRAAQEGDVMEMAKAWAIDPTFKNRLFKPGLGMVGRFDINRFMGMENQEISGGGDGK